MWPGPAKGKFASYNGTAPIDASSGEQAEIHRRYDSLASAFDLGKLLSTPEVFLPELGDTADAPFRGRARPGCPAAFLLAEFDPADLA